MADLLLELFSEEIPARMQAQAAKDLERLVVGSLSDRGLLFEGAKAFAGARRLTLAIAGLPTKQPDVSEELKGPKVDAPQAALDGFLRKTGLTKDQLKVEKTPKGDVYLAVIERAGRATAEVLSEILPECFAKLPWPKSMRWGSLVTVGAGALGGPGGLGTGHLALGSKEQFRWVRPLRNVLCTFDGEVIPFVVAQLTANNITWGHRFLSSGSIEVRRYDDYVEKLRKAHVILDAEERKAIIFEAVKSAAFVHGLEMIPDEGLLDEVAGLAEWPVVLIGAIQDEFMDVPPDILQTSMRTHQKYFSLRDPKTGKMANRFALVANMIADDGGKEIVAGNERVLRARLSDAKFFWDQDRKRTLASRVDDLKPILFHAKLGTQYERMAQVQQLAIHIAMKLRADSNSVTRAVMLAKADLTTGVVGEFPELQGTMGRYYALHDGENSSIADAIRDHYRPQGPTDSVPSENISLIVALADKVHTLVGLFAIGERPSGSGDPYALRRAALGIIRIVLENSIRLGLGDLVRLHASLVANSITNALPANETSDQLLAFFADRLKVALREKGTRHDLIDAVFSLGNEDDLVRLVARVEALQSFLKTDEGANLLAGYKRGANILKAEEKKDKTTFDGEPDASLLVLPEEKALGEALSSASKSIADDVAAEKFVEAMGVMAKLRSPVDAFFDKVTVNDKDAKLRENRLKLLARLRATLHQVADFSKIEG